ncbi:hypothetical protein QQS21_002414 [Conoideocrella luteorostrata]|uniref:Magnesium transporter n=1 Tax=Conoideocrella luteorostrata TaxID=1105319 RepID=A0AAJ0CV81_9HYPO|nr:hypothetical protein QQS21_002414 [Conoideocrella luteorostrata]
MAIGLLSYFTTPPNRQIETKIYTTVVAYTPGRPKFAMAWFSKTMTFAGLILLAHSCYSAQEHSAISSTLKTHALGPHHTGSALPIDICIETIVATLIICLGTVVGSEKLHPVRWQVWAGKIEREGEVGFIDGSGQVDKVFRGSPFSVLESRLSFLDIRRQRREFAEWAKGKNAY